VFLPCPLSLGKGKFSDPSAGCPGSMLCAVCSSMLQSHLTGGVQGLSPVVCRLRSFPTSGSSISPPTVRPPAICLLMVPTSSAPFPSPLLRCFQQPLPALLCASFQFCCLFSFVFFFCRGISLWSGGCAGLSQGWLRDTV
jgi:hypothetical protein